MSILQNRQSGLEEVAEVVSPIGERDLACFAAEWKPVLDAKVEELKRSGQYTTEGVALHNVEDAHWHWVEKVRERAPELQWKSFAVRCGGKTQGLMFTNMLRRARLPEQAGEHMVYVDLLSTAPWNRQRLSARPLYRGVGELLMVEALLVSRDEGFGGRIGLHSLPSATAFYRDHWGMQSLGPDPQYDDLHYFELAGERAMAFLSE